MIALLVMTDGRRDCIARTIASARLNLAPPALISERWIHNDSPDPDFARWLRETFPDFRIATAAIGRRSGFAGAIRSAWAHLRVFSTAPYIFHLEDDFVFNRPVDLAAMAAVLDLEPNLLQLALRRQPWNDEERAAGGIVELHPDDFHDRRTIIDAETSVEWLAHRRFFTTNPNLYRRSLIEFSAWPDGANSEGRFSIARFEADPATVAGYLGARDSGEAVEHIGHQRVGTGY